MQIISVEIHDFFFTGMSFATTQKKPKTQTVKWNTRVPQTSAQISSNIFISNASHA